VSILPLKKLRPLGLIWQRRLHAHAAAKSLLVVLSWSILATTAAAAGDDQPFKCGESADAYRGYKINNVRIVTPLAIKTPLSFLFGAQAKLQDEFAAVLPHLPLQNGSKFDRVANSVAIDMLGQVYNERVVQPGERIRIAFVTYRLENCNTTAETIDVVYLVYSSDFFYYASRIFEKPNDKITRSLAPGKIVNSKSLANTTNKFLPQPLVGFDDARKIVAGTRASLQTKGGILDRFALDLSGSPNSVVTDVNLSGSREYNDSWISHLDWRLAYDYFDLPTDEFKQKSGSGVAQLFGASKPLTNKGIILRFGTSIEGGNRQIDRHLPFAVFAEEQAGYRAIKSYVGATINHGRQAWAGSYGLQLASNGDDTGIGYLKHIFDASYRARFLRREHDPIRLEVNFAAGTAHSRTSPIPIVERFFGGNKQRPFIEGDDWIINSSPLIRSFPQNGLSRVGLNDPIGGTDYLSFNLTASKPVWHRAAVPKEISDDPTIRDVVAGGLRTARAATLEVYLSDEQPFIALADELRLDHDPSKIEGNLPELEKAFTSAVAVLDELKARTPKPPDAVIESISELQAEDGVIESMKNRLERIAVEKDTFRALSTELLVGLSGGEGIVPSLIEGLTGVTTALREAQMTEDAKRVENTTSDLSTILTAMLPKVNKLSSYGKIDPKVFQPARAILQNDNAPDDVKRVLKRLRTALEQIEKDADVIPTIGRSSMFVQADIKDAGSLTVKFQKKKDPVSRHLFSQLTPNTQQQIVDYKEDEPFPKALLTALVDDLNRILRGPSIFEESRFEDVDLSDETTTLAGQNPQGINLVRLNRLLLAEAFSDEISQSQLDELIDPLETDLDDADLMVTLALGDLATTSIDKIRNSIHRLMIGYGELAPSLVKRIAKESKPIVSLLIKEGRQTEAGQLSIEVDKLVAFAGQTRAAFNAIPLSRAEQKTDFDIAYSASALDVVFRELNLVEVSPVVMFDAARLGPKKSPGFGGFRYGAGPALRFSVVTLDFTAGYSFNLNRKPMEGRGAFVFSMTISDLFR
jgi:hypothetical protein